MAYDLMIVSHGRRCLDSRRAIAEDASRFEPSLPEASFGHPPVENSIQQLDVWAIGDYGIKVAVKNPFNLRKMPDAKKLEKIGERWKPYRSVASWYLWRSLELRHRDEE
jgi:hypothetical protein